MSHSQLSLYQKALEYLTYRNQGSNNYQIADRFGVSEASVRRAFKRLREIEGGERPADRPQATVDINGERATVQLPVQPISLDLDLTDLNDAERILRARGLRPEDGWQLQNIRTAERYTDIGNEARITLTAKKVAPPFVLRPGLADRKLVINAPKRRPRPRGEQLVVVLPDPHGGHVDRALAERIAEFIRDVRPTKIIINGDVLDCENISRWKQLFPKIWGLEMQADLDTAVWFMSLWRAAAPEDCECLYFLGNHDIRIDKLLIENAPQLYGLRRGGAPDELPVMSVQNLLRSEEIGWRYVESEHGHYPFTSVELIPGELVVMHGVATGKNALYKNLERRGFSIIGGHSHHQRYMSSRVETAPGVWKNVVIVEAGHLSHQDGGHGYAPSNDWTQGFCTVAIHADQTFDVDFARYEAGTLRWRGTRWEAEQRVAA